MIEPYYDHGGITIYCADNREVLESLKPQATGLAPVSVVTDPPYNVGFKYTDLCNDRKEQLQYREWCEGWFDASMAMLPGQVCISCGMSNLGMWLDMAKPQWIVAWHKPAAMGRCAIGFNNWEPVLFYGKAPRAICDVFSAGIKPDGSVAGHPCPKPIEWGRWQVANLTADESLVIDPFAGSGTVLRAAKDLGRRAIGIEIEERYCEIAAKRLAQEVLF